MEAAGVDPRATASLARAVLATGLLAAGLFALTLLFSVPASGRSSGRIFASGNPAVNGANTCAQCHVDDVEAPMVSIVGPDVLAPGETAMFQVVIAGGPGRVGGFNVSTSDTTGLLGATDPNIRFESDELTHVTPRAFVDGAVAFEFTYTAPIDPGDVTMYSAAVSANAANANFGDGVGTATKAIAVGEQPSMVKGADTPIETTHVVSCLAGNGRVDTNFVNTGPAAAIYRLEFEGLTPRQVAVDSADWARIPITGRPDANFTVRVLRDGTEISLQTITVSCDEPTPTIGADEIQVVNSCRGGFGYLLFQFLNPTSEPVPLIIEFEGVANRSTTAAAYGQTVRAVTGRPSGTYDVLVRTGQTPIAAFPVTVDCG